MILHHATSDQPVAARAFLLQSPPGLANVLKKEMVFAGLIDRKQELFIKRQRNHDLLFANRLKSSEGFARLRIAEAVYRAPIFGRFKISKRQLDILAGELQALGPRRLVTQIAGRHFDRRDLGRWLEKEAAARGYHFDENVEDEVWMFAIDEAFYFGIPIMKARDVVGRASRVQEREGSLPPPIAAALAFAGGARPDDVILDPVCGSGTLLSEVHAYAPLARRTGLDIDASAIQTARANLGDATGLFLEVADSRQRPVEGLTLLLANLPFGKRFGDRQTNVDLYRDILINALAKADRARFRAVMLSSDVESLRGAFKVKIRGEVAIAVIVKPKSSRSN
jgi:predicted RNA methylase